MTEEPNDPLLTTPPEGIPGALFVAIAALLEKEYARVPTTPTGRNIKARLTAVKILETLTAYYEKLENHDG